MYPCRKDAYGMTVIEAAAFGRQVWCVLEAKLDRVNFSWKTKESFRSTTTKLLKRSRISVPNIDENRLKLSKSGRRLWRTAENRIRGSHCAEKANDAERMRKEHSRIGRCDMPAAYPSH